MNNKTSTYIDRVFMIIFYNGLIVQIYVKIESHWDNC